MIACAVILAIFLPIAFLPAALESLFSPGELFEMGIRFRESQVDRRIRTSDNPGCKTKGTAFGNNAARIHLG
jgi:hypothetical protein